MFILVFVATFFPYVVPYMIPVDDYVRIWSFPSHIFILFLYVGLDQLISGIDLIHIYNRFLRHLFFTV